MRKPYYFKDVYDYKGDWNYLLIKYENEQPPNVGLLADGKNKTILTNGTNRIFWGAIKTGNYGMYLLKNYDKHKGFIEAINAHVMHDAPKYESPEFSKFWSRYFIKSLSSSDSSFLFDGLWIMKNKIVKHASLKEITKQTQISFASWDHTIEVVALKAIPDEYNGRVKWWRKRIKESTCPPILLWELHNSYIVIDGHARLTAYFKEGLDARCLVIQSVYAKEKTVTADKKNILDWLEKYYNGTPNEEINIDLLNKNLIALHDSSPALNLYSKSSAKRDLETTWLKEVKAFENTDAGQYDIGDMLEN